MQNEELQHKIEETIQSIDGIKRAEANPFLYTRVMEKLNSAPAASFIKKWVLWPVSAAIVLMIVVNVRVLTRVDNSALSDNIPEDSYVSIHSYSY